MGDDGADVTREKVLVAPNADEERTSAAGPDNLGGMIRMDNSDAIGAHHILEREANSFGERGPVGAGVVRVDFLIMLANDVGEHFGVGLGGKRVAFGEKPFLEKQVVFDHAVMNERNLAGLIEVWVGIGVGWRSMRRPARVANAHVTLGGLFGEDSGEIVDAAALLAEFESS